MMSTFGELLRERRRTLNLTQADVASRIGVSNTYISALESGRKQAPPRALVEALAASLEISAESLWGAARAEREARLRMRINGVPTSLRTSASPATDSAAEDAYLDHVLRPLKESLRKTENPEKVVRALKALADSLGGQPDT